MLYSKPALTFEQQADQLLSRGLIADRDELITRLKAVNYYRLSGYLYPFRQLPSENFAPGTNLTVVWRRYTFDRRLRLVLLDAIERIEVAVRTRLVYHFAQAHGPFGHLDERNLPGFKRIPLAKRFVKAVGSFLKGKGVQVPRSDFRNWLGKLSRETNRANDTFVKHFRSVYGDKHQSLPLWMVCELMSGGSVLDFADGVAPNIQKQVAADFGFPDQQLLSWMKAVFSLRNACAHHARVWNRVFGVKPSIPGKNKHPDWHIAPTFDVSRIGMLMTVLHHWLGKISTTSQWKLRLFALFDEFPEIPLAEMGIPADWRSRGFWQ